MSKHRPVSERSIVNQKIRDARKLKGLTQRQAAEKMGILYNTYQIIERRGNITFEFVFRFCEALGVPKSFFQDIFLEEEVLTSPVTKTFTFRSPSTIVDKFYGSEVEQEEPQIKAEENKKTVIVEITHTENGIINTYRGLSKAKQKEAMNFINSIK